MWWAGWCCCRGRRWRSWRCGRGIRWGAGGWGGGRGRGAPLVLPARGGVAVQVMVGGPDSSGAREVGVYARAGDAGTGEAWVRHASGLVGPAGPPGAELEAGELAVWPPAGAVAADVGELYAGLAAAGYGYGPAFRGVRAAWVRGAEVFVEAALPEGTAAAGFGVHPALLDAVLHGAGLAGEAGERGGGAGEVWLPFAWADVVVHAAGAGVLRARLRPDGSGGIPVLAVDAAGAAVVSVGSLVSRPVAAGQLAAADRGPRDALFCEEWVPVPVAAAVPAGRWVVAGADWLGLAAGLAAAGADVVTYPDLGALAAAVAAGGPVPEVVLACAGSAAAGAAAAGAGPGGGGGGGGRGGGGGVLGLGQGWRAEGVLAGSRLVVVTAGAVA